jgi:transposase
VQLRYDEDLVETAVFLCAGGHRPGIPSLQIRRFHAEREKLYRILDADERNAAFFRLHLDWFREWGLEQALLDVVDEFPLLRRELAALAFRKARHRGEEGAELFVSAETGRNAVVALRAERFAADAELQPFLRHELAHLHDMLDPAFGYSPELPTATAADRARERLIRGRYRLLWNITVDGRLIRAGRATPGNEQTHRTAFDRAFDFWPEPRRNEIFDRLWNDPQPRHPDLLALAADPRQTRRALHPEPGAPCPLCGFPTFVWATAERLTDALQVAIRREFPNWTPEQGACARCAEVYRLRAAAGAA